MIRLPPTRVAVLIGALLLAAATPAADNEFPSFKAGQWLFTSTLTVTGAPRPQKRTVRVCTDPGADIKKRWDELAVQSCKFSPIEHSGNRYTYKSTCQKDGRPLLTISTITVESDSAYRIETESRTSGLARKDEIVAERLGDCAVVPRP